MRLRFLLGRAGSGKTFRCLEEIRAELLRSAEGPELWLLTPKQATYQMERQLLRDGSLQGFARLQVLSFERLAQRAFRLTGRPTPELLTEEGRVMVLRALLAKKKDSLKLFRASARLSGFARQLSQTLSELQRNEVGVDTLRALAARFVEQEVLPKKLEDLANLLEAYLAWLKSHQLRDADCLLPAAVEAFSQPLAGAWDKPSLWVDGFADFSDQEIQLLGALLPCCRDATITFCLDRTKGKTQSWLSAEAVAFQSFEKCRRRLAEIPGLEEHVEVIRGGDEQTRFAQSSALGQLEARWNDGTSAGEIPGEQLEKSLRLVQCQDPTAEARVAAREILRHVRGGGRYREVMIVLRNLETHHNELRKVFGAYEIPYFLDRRENVAHHPLSELTRNALRTIVFGWQHEDWFTALKTGLVPVREDEIDQLENAALACGWNGTAWSEPLQIPGEPDLSRALAGTRERILPPFQRLGLASQRHGNTPTGEALAAMLRDFWRDLRVEEQLQSWAAEGKPSGASADSSHLTVWTQINTWLDSLDLAFSREKLPLRDWLPILDAGLANLTVGLIPPALDQVLIGAVDRSRNPDVSLAIVLGLNEKVFPALPQSSVLLTDSDREELSRMQVTLSGNLRRQMARERFYAYLAVTRSRERLVLTYSMRDSAGQPLQPSPILHQVQRVFPQLKIENPAESADTQWADAEHPSELAHPFLDAMLAPPAGHESPGWPFLAGLPFLGSLLSKGRDFQRLYQPEQLEPSLAERLYGPTLKSSVSRLEQFAACPFKFFIHSGLRAEERIEFKLDRKEQGNFQHEVLALFHDRLVSQEKKWRDLTPAEARQLIAAVAGGVILTYRNGLLYATDRSRFLARVMTESLQDFIETIVGWMHSQYLFDPAQVELSFGEGEAIPAWEIDLGAGHRLALRGRIDRIDLWRGPDGKSSCLVIDYKSSERKLDALLLKHGLQLQLPAYLLVLLRLPEARALLAEELAAVGVFYVNLWGKFRGSGTRTEALAKSGENRKLGYRHSGRFDRDALALLDARKLPSGDQFNFRLTQDRKIFQNCQEPLPREEFEALLDSVEKNLIRMGQAIFSGKVEISPYRKGSAKACDLCEYQAICRIDPWTHSYRVLD